LTKKVEAAKDLFDEQLVQEIAGAVIKSEWKHKDGLYQRNLKTKGYMGKQLATLDRLDDIAEVEKPLNPSQPVI
jgi:hypothetical protein